MSEDFLIEDNDPVEGINSAPKEEPKEEQTETKTESNEKEEQTETKSELNEEDKKGEKEEQAPKKTRAQKRIEKLITEKYEAQAEIKSLKEKLEKSTKLARNDDPELEEELDKDIEKLEKELEELEELDNSTEAEPNEKELKESAKKPIDIELNKAIDKMAYSFDEGRDKYEDFNDVIEKAPFTTKDIVMNLSELDNPSEIAYYLAKNVKELKKLIDMPKKEQLVALIKLELSSPKIKNTASTTKASDPINPVGAGIDSKTKNTIELASSGSFSDFEKRRNKEEKEKGKFY